MQYILIFSLTTLTLALVYGKKEVDLKKCEEESREAINKLDFIHGVKFDLLEVGRCGASLMTGRIVTFEGILKDDNGAIKACNVIIREVIKGDRATTKVIFECPLEGSLVFTYTDY